MSHIRVKTTYVVQDGMGGSIKQELYCDHNQSCDCITFFDKDGSVTAMAFEEWATGNDLWDAMQRLWYPFEDKWGGALKEGVEYYYIPPWETKENQPI